MTKPYLWIIIIAFSCDDFLNIKPVGQVIPETAEEFRGLMTNAYGVMPSYKARLNYLTDDIVLNTSNPTFVEQYLWMYSWNSEARKEGAEELPYSSFYKSLFLLNQIISSESKIIGNPKNIANLLAEAYALRAYIHFELHNLFAGAYDPILPNIKTIPLSISTDIYRTPSRNTQKEVFDQILSDISTALNKFSSTDTETKTADNLKYRFSKTAVQVFASRVYLYMKVWTKVLEYGQTVLTENKFVLQNLNAMPFSPATYTSSEMIMALDETIDFDLLNRNYISPDALTVIKDIEGDLRQNTYFKKETNNWQTIKIGDQSSKSSFRLVEIYLNMAEASAQLGNLAQAREMLLTLMKNRIETTKYETYQNWINSLEKATLLKQIYQQRRIELMFEGHRWYDLQRWKHKTISRLIDGQTYTLDFNEKPFVCPFPIQAVADNPLLKL